MNITIDKDKFLKSWDKTTEASWREAPKYHKPEKSPKVPEKFIRDKKGDILDRTVTEALILLNNQINSIISYLKEKEDEN